MYRKEYNVETKDNDPYWDEGFNYYPKIKWYNYRRPKKRLLMYQVRMYKTWKHNRKNQWK